MNLIIFMNNNANFKRIELLKKCKGNSMEAFNYFHKY